MSHIRTSRESNLNTNSMQKEQRWVSNSIANEYPSGSKVMPHIENLSNLLVLPMDSSLLDSKRDLESNTPKPRLE